ncbi:hypothetical protein SAMN04488038_105282 [Solimonas aquatica]|uniref:26 kDa periplasmic immunogenic protein n=1 Tax=Solimonas aquatica TaxID=489703 RepID=A0A1H9F9K4_9GAMM|nr:SIMPL domain-containing protein [Solimonas aquatica]SEQ33988.1 hypothetical protein SAMN04488038_105282 [Solimonas aquatica]
MRKPLAVLTVLCLLGFAAQAAHAAEPPPPRIVSVSGQGEVSVKPDRAQLSLTADALDANLKKAQEQVNTIVRNYLAEAKKLGTTDKDISTAGVSVAPEYVWEPKQNRQRLVGYRARRDIAVLVRNLDQLGDYLQRATDVGINHVNPPQLESSRSTELKRQALAAAASDARDKAKLLAETLDMKLGAVRSLRVDDNINTPPVPMVKAFAMRAEAASADMSGNEQMGLATGEIKYTANANADFDLLER